MPLLVGARLGSYEIVAPIGAGGMGEVYRANDTQLGRAVAIKVLPDSVVHDAERVARFEREARALAALNHPNIASIYGLERLRPSRAEDQDIRGEGSASARAGGGAPAQLEKSGLGALALVMELVEGPTLADRIAQGPLPLDEALPIARQIAEALEAAHEQGIIHRDLKPANVKVRDDGTVKVLDFGLAKLTDAGALTGDPSLSPTFTSLGTMQGTIVGTAAYMSPEQARGRPVDKRTDVWAFGAVLYEMLTGRRAFQGEDATEIIASVVKTTPDWTPLDASAPSAIRGLVRGCLEKDRKARVGDLSVARFLLSSAAPAETPAPTASPQPRFALLPWAVAAAFLVVAAGLGVVHFRERPTPQRSYRFQLPSPERVQFRLSPDGSRIVYSLGSLPNDRLGVLSLDSAVPVPLAGTEGASYPFWSPDGREIAFFTRDKLKKIPAAGGLPVTVCDVVNGRGGAWNRDGVILFAPDAFGGLYRVSSDSGTPIAVTKVDEKTDGGDRFPEFLPDGDRFLFLRSASKDGGLYTTSLSGGPVTRIIPDISNGIYVPGRSAGGFLLFRRDNTLMALPFDARGARTTGGVIPIADQVSVAGNIGYGAFSAAQDGTVMFRTGAREGNRQMIWLDRAGKRLGLIGKPDEISVPALSPDGKVVAFTIGNTTAGVADVWLQNLETGGQSRFTLGGGMASGAPLWAPDSSRIVYTSASGNTWQLRQLSAAGAGSPEVLLQGPYNSPAATDWSKDGRLIVFNSRTEKTKDDLYLLSTEGDRKAIPFLQTAANEVNAKFSPDGQWLAYSSDESGAPEVFVQHVPANGTKIQISMAGGSFPVWSRDGKELFFRDLTQSMIAVPVKAGATFERGQARVLFDGTRSRGPFEVSPDGQRFLAVTTADGAEQPTFTVITNWQPPRQPAP